jgi:hypothetical protein
VALPRLLPQVERASRVAGAERDAALTPGNELFIAELDHQGVAARPARRELIVERFSDRRQARQQ